MLSVPLILSPPVKVIENLALRLLLLSGANDAMVPLNVPLPIPLSVAGPVAVIPLSPMAPVALVTVNVVVTLAAPAVRHIASPRAQPVKVRFIFKESSTPVMYTRKILLKRLNRTGYSYRQLRDRLKECISGIHRGQQSDLSLTA